MADKPKGEKGFDIEEDLSKIEIPDVLPVLPLRGIVIFPNQIFPFLVSRASSLKLIEDVGGRKRSSGWPRRKILKRNPRAPTACFNTVPRCRS